MLIKRGTKIQKDISLGASAFEIERQKNAARRIKEEFGGDSMRFFVHSYGCQLNVSDGEKISGWLSGMGMTETEELSSADVVVYNTCAIRESAVERVFGNIGALKHYKRKNPRMLIILCGCMAQYSDAAERIKQKFRFVDLCFGTHRLFCLPEMILEHFETGERGFYTENHYGIITEGIPVLRRGQAKAWLPISFGCDNFCSYCVVPYLRGRERSRDQDIIVKEFEGLVAAGAKEITLLGQNVNSYGKGDFPVLLDRLAKIPGDFRIKFMTSHPKDASKELFEVMSRYDKIAKYLHLPIQSGNDEILKRMNRGYTAAQYEKKIERAKELMPELTITSDIIVGFPGESYEQFNDTLGLIKKTEYDSLFTFIYSKRDGTAAASLPDPVERKEKSEWFKELLDVQRKIGHKRNLRHQGKTLRVLCEEEGEGGRMFGRTDGNIGVTFTGDKNDIGKFLDIKITKTQSFALEGEKNGCDS